MKITILGCGTSSGVPRMGNDWGECDPGEPRNRRTRASAVVEHAGTKILIDTSPDMRAQMLAADLVTLDAVIWTHDHADHCHGIDDLRQVYRAMGSSVRGLARQATIDALTTRFSYVFEGRMGYPATVAAELLSDVVQIGSIQVSAVDQPHGTIFSTGLRFEADGKAIGYATDFNEMTPKMLRLFESLDVWVIDALRHAPHPTHMNVEQALRCIAAVRPKTAVLTHMDESMDYHRQSKMMPPGVTLGFDGMTLET